MKKNVEYNSLREEIIGLVSVEQNYIIAMYTITIAILTFAIQQKNEWLFLLPYIILFSFQRIISAKKDIRLRMRAYIAVFLDKELGWEKNYNEIYDQTTAKHNSSDKFSKFMNVVSGRISSLQLGVVCSAGCVIMSMNDLLASRIWETNILDELKAKDIFPIFLAILLFGGLREWCKNSLNATQRRNQYIESLTVYKDKIENNEK